ncbi:MAG: anthranilate synthase component I [Burkholderiales bacterium]
MKEAEFKRLAAEGYNRIPLVLETFADLDTPLSLYLKLANAPNTYLLESVVGGERFGRYSFIGLPARVLMRVFDRRVEIVQDDAVIETFEGNPLDFIEDYQRRMRVAPVAGLPRFSGGLTGYFGYETVRYIEPKLAGVKKPDPLGTPDILLLQTEELAVVDNLRGKISLIVHADPSQSDAYSLAQERLRELRLRLRAPIAPTLQHASSPSESTTNFAKEDYLAAVARAKQYIFDGDMMQVQIGQRIAKPYTDSPLALYRALRSLNPSPYMYYYDFGGFHVVGASPEILVRQERGEHGTTVTIRPLAGTRPRGATPEADKKLAEELLSDPKEIAEHVMLIDLARNDIGRIAQIGTVKVPDQLVIERYSHVMHIVSNVEGMLKPGMSSLDVLRATFPAGTLSGAPKVRAMEIIDELEPEKRGIYGGAVGYLSYQGDMDLAIAIRTGVIKDGVLYAQAAAGIVADSVPESEWQETRNKARALLQAAEQVQAGLDEQD